MEEEKKAVTQGLNTKDWCVLAHLSGLLGYIIPGVGGVVGSFLVWYFKKDESPEIDRHGREALNFQIAVFVYAALVSILTVVIIGFLLIPVIVLYHLIFTVIASKVARDGGFYRYPGIFRVLPENS